MLKRLRTVLTAMTVLTGVCAGVMLVLALYPVIYRARIYPGVHVHGLALGGLTVDEATSLLINTLPDATEQTVELVGGANTWEIGWADAGRSYDCAGTAKAAYQVARDGRWHSQVLAPWRLRFTGRSVEAHIAAIDPSRVEAEVDAIARQFNTPPTEAELQIHPEEVTCTSGTAGRALNVEATTEKVIAALTNGAEEVRLETITLQPELQEPEPGCTQARALLSEPVTLVVNDPLTSYQADFKIPPERVARWLRVIVASGEVLLEIDEPSVEAWLLAVAPQLGSERILDVEETLTHALAALRSGEHHVQAAIGHPPNTYVVEPGDTLFDIAYNHGFPQWRLEEANPDIEPNELLIGMELTIPSIDVLFPEPLVPGRRIEIDLPEQRVRAYEEDEMVYDFTCSSGMTSTPTIAGQFQVLFKEPQAHAQRWSLEMPYFMAIYYEGPGFANGIHELPIRSNGQRLWASVLGWPASYGCIILDIGDAEKLYNWAPVGTLVRIEGVAPGTPAYVPTYEQQAPGG